MIVKVRFHADGSEFFFGSLAAIYDLFNEEQIGCSLHTLWNCKISPDNPKATARCVISKHKVWRKKSGR